MKKLQMYFAVAVVLFGCVMILASFCVPPPGVIDASVLAAFGEVLTFSGTVIGIDYKYRNKE